MLPILLAAVLLLLAALTALAILLAFISLLTLVALALIPLLALAAILLLLLAGLILSARLILAVLVSLALVSLALVALTAVLTLSHEAHPFAQLDASPSRTSADPIPGSAVRRRYSAIKVRKLAIQILKKAKIPIDHNTSITELKARRVEDSKGIMDI